MMTRLFRLPIPTLLLIHLVLFLHRIDCILDESSFHPSSRANWNLSFETFPSTVVYVTSLHDVADCITDSNLCPSPVRAVGSMASVTASVVADGGSLVDLSGYNKVLSFNTTSGVITLEAGAKLGDLHPYLLREHHREISFQPEMGLATVGSLAVTTGKDSSVNGPGYFGALVTSLKYVNHQGDLVHLDKQRDSTAFQEFLCSFGLQGIVVEVSLQTRLAAKILTRFQATRVKNAHHAFKILQAARQKADNVYFLLSPDQGVVVSMERYTIQNAPKQSFFHKRLNRFSKTVIQRVAYYTIQHGIPYTDARFDFTLKNLGIVDTLAKLYSYVMPTYVTHYRSEFTNRYSPVTKQQDRLDFSLFFFSDESRLEEVFLETYRFTREWYATTGFAPSGFNMYFVQRTGETLCGMFRGEAGVSFAMDPYYSNPDSLEWKAFVQALTAMNLRLGAEVSPTQTRFLEPGQYRFHQSLIKRSHDGGATTERFVTPFYQQFMGSSPATRIEDGYY